MLTAASGRDLRTAGVMAAVLYWRLTALTPINPGPLPWLPGIPSTLPAHPVWGPTWQSDPTWSLTSPPRSTATPAKGTAHQYGLHREVTQHRPRRRYCAVWRAANGIDPQDPRPTGGGGHLETLPALWKQRLDRDIAHATNPPADARPDQRQAGRTAISPSGDRQRRCQTPERRPSGPSAPPVDSTVVSTLPNLALSDQGPGFARPAARVLPTVRAAPPTLTTAVTPTSFAAPGRRVLARTRGRSGRGLRGRGHARLGLLRRSGT